jgi:transcriptional regulator GlxA family with amidase domain
LSGTVLYASHMSRPQRRTEERGSPDVACPGVLASRNGAKSGPKRRVAFLIFDSFQLLDAAGPISAFEVAADIVPGAYELLICAISPGSISSSSGACMTAMSARGLSKLDTVVVVGGKGTEAAVRCAKTRRWVKGWYGRGSRVASVCTGTYVLAACGLLTGKRATTHWFRTHDFASRFPEVQLEPDRIYVRDGRVWSSAGISAGIDLALALITEDLGEDVARDVARELVVYYRRPGGQSQFSPLLVERSGGRLDGILGHIRAHLSEDLSVHALSRVANMSPRNFSRQFKIELGVSPAQAVARIRAEAARALLELPGASAKEVSHACGFGDPERLRRTMVRLFGGGPASERRLRNVTPVFR